MPDTPKQIVRQLRDSLEWLESELGSVPASSILDQSLREADEVVRKLKKLRETHRERDAAAEGPRREPQQDESTAAKPPAAGAGGPQKREYVLLALEELGRPASPALISTLIKGIWNAEVQASQFASIRKGDERAWARGRRARPLIVPALNAFDLSARPRTYAVSTWPAARRVMGPLSDRADALRIFLSAAQRCDNKHAGAWRTVMNAIATDFRLGGPGKETKRMVEDAERALGAIGDDDARERQIAAERLGRLSERWQLFGRPLSYDVVEGGKHA